MQFVTDRTEADVLLGNEKGQYSYTDLNRVEQAVAQLCALAVQLDLYPELSTKTDWGLPGEFSSNSWPVEDQMKRYLQNVADLCGLFELPAAGLPAGMGQLTWEGANAIEKALGTVYSRVMEIINSFRYSGEFYAGEEIGI